MVIMKNMVSSENENNFVHSVSWAVKILAFMILIVHHSSAVTTTMWGTLPPFSITEDPIRQFDWRNRDVMQDDVVYQNINSENRSVIINLPMTQLQSNKSYIQKSNTNLILTKSTRYPKITENHNDTSSSAKIQLKRLFEEETEIGNEGKDDTKSNGMKCTHFMKKCPSQAMPLFLNVRVTHIEEQKVTLTDDKEINTKMVSTVERKICSLFDGSYCYVNGYRKGSVVTDIEIYFTNETTSTAAVAERLSTIPQDELTIDFTECNVTDVNGNTTRCVTSTQMPSVTTSASSNASSLVTQQTSTTEIATPGATTTLASVGASTSNLGETSFSTVTDISASLTGSSREATLTESATSSESIAGILTSESTSYEPTTLGLTTPPTSVSISTNSETMTTGSTEKVTTVSQLAGGNETKTVSTFSSVTPVSSTSSVNTMTIEQETSTLVVATTGPLSYTNTGTSLLTKDTTESITAQPQTLSTSESSVFSTTSGDETLGGGSSVSSAAATEITSSPESITSGATTRFTAVHTDTTSPVSAADVITTAAPATAETTTKLQSSDQSTLKIETTTSALPETTSVQSSETTKTVSTAVEAESTANTMMVEVTTTEAALSTEPVAAVLTSAGPTSEPISTGSNLMTVPSTSGGDTSAATLTPTMETEEVVITTDATTIEDAEITVFASVSTAHVETVSTPESIVISTTSSAEETTAEPSVPTAALTGSSSEANIEASTPQSSITPGPTTATAVDTDASLSVSTNDITTVGLTATAELSSSSVVATSETETAHTEIPTTASVQYVSTSKETDATGVTSISVESSSELILSTEVQTSAANMQDSTTDEITSTQTTSTEAVPIAVSTTLGIDTPTTTAVKDMTKSSTSDSTTVETAEITSSSASATTQAQPIPTSLGDETTAGSSVSTVVMTEISSSQATTKASLPESVTSGAISSVTAFDTDTSSVSAPYITTEAISSDQTTKLPLSDATTSKIETTTIEVQAATSAQSTYAATTISAETETDTTAATSTVIDASTAAVVSTDAATDVITSVSSAKDITTERLSSAMDSTISTESDSITSGDDTTSTLLTPTTLAKVSTSEAAENTASSSEVPTTAQAETISTTESNIISTSSFVEDTTAGSTVSTAAMIETSSHVGTEDSTPEGVTSGSATGLSGVDTEITSYVSAQVEAVSTSQTNVVISTSMGDETIAGSSFSTAEISSSEVTTEASPTEVVTSGGTTSAATVDTDTSLSVSATDMTTGAASTAETTTKLPSSDVTVSKLETTIGAQTTTTSAQLPDIATTESPATQPDTAAATLTGIDTSTGEVSTDASTDVLTSVSSDKDSTTQVLTSAQSSVLTSTVSSETDSVPVSTTLGGDMTSASFAATSEASEDTGTSSKAPTSIQAETSSSTELNVISTSSFVDQTTAGSSVSTAAMIETSSHVGTEASTPEGVTSGSATGLSGVDTEITSSVSASDMTTIGTTSTIKLSSLESTTSGMAITTVAEPSTSSVQSPDTVSTVSSATDTGTTAATSVSVESSSESIVSTGGLTSAVSARESTTEEITPIETSATVSVSPSDSVPVSVSMTESSDTTSTPLTSTGASDAATLETAETTVSSSATAVTAQAEIISTSESNIVSTSLGEETASNISTDVVTSQATSSAIPLTDVVTPGAATTATPVDTDTPLSISDTDMTTAAASTVETTSNLASSGVTVSKIETTILEQTTSPTQSPDIATTKTDTTAATSSGIDITTGEVVSRDASTAVLTSASSAEDSTTEILTSAPTTAMASTESPETDSIPASTTLGGDMTSTSLMPPIEALTTVPTSYATTSEAAEVTGPSYKTPTSIQAESSTTVSNVISTASPVDETTAGSSVSTADMTSTPVEVPTGTTTGSASAADMTTIGTTSTVKFSSSDATTSEMEITTIASPGTTLVQSPDTASLVSTTKETGATVVTSMSVESSAGSIHSTDTLTFAGTMHDSTTDKITSTETSAPVSLSPTEAVSVPVSISASDDTKSTTLSMSTEAVTEASTSVTATQGAAEITASSSVTATAAQVETVSTSQSNVISTSIGDETIAGSSFSTAEISSSEATTEASPTEVVTSGGTSSAATVDIDASLSVSATDMTTGAASTAETTTKLPSSGVTVSKIETTIAAQTTTSAQSSDTATTESTATQPDTTAATLTAIDTRLQSTVLTSEAAEDTVSSSTAPTSIQAATSSTIESNVISTASYVEETTAKSSVSITASTEISSQVSTEASTPEGVTSETATSSSGIDTEITSSASASDMSITSTFKLSSSEATSGMEITTIAEPATTLVQSSDIASTVSSTKETDTTVSVESSAGLILSTDTLTSAGTMQDSTAAEMTATETSATVSVSPIETVSVPKSISASGDTTPTALTMPTEAATKVSTSVAATLGAAETTASSSATTTNAQVETISTSQSNVISTSIGDETITGSSFSTAEISSSDAATVDTDISSVSDTDMYTTGAAYTGEITTKLPSSGVTVSKIETTIAAQTTTTTAQSPDIATTEYTATKTGSPEATLTGIDTSTGEVSTGVSTEIPGSAETTAIGSTVSTESAVITISTSSGGDTTSTPLTPSTETLVNVFTSDATTSEAVEDTGSSSEAPTTAQAETVSTTESNVISTVSSVEETTAGSSVSTAEVTEISSQVSTVAPTSEVVTTGTATSSSGVDTEIASSASASDMSTVGTTSTVKISSSEATSGTQVTSIAATGSTLVQSPDTASTASTTKETGTTVAPSVGVDSPTGPIHSTLTSAGTLQDSTINEITSTETSAPVSLSPTETVSVPVSISASGDTTSTASTMPNEAGTKASSSVAGTIGAAETIVSSSPTATTAQVETVSTSQTNVISTSVGDETKAGSSFTTAAVTEISSSEATTEAVPTEVITSRGTTSTATVDTDTSLSVSATDMTTGAASPAETTMKLPSSDVTVSKIETTTSAQSPDIATTESAATQPDTSAATLTGIDTSTGEVSTDASTDMLTSVSIDKDSTTQVLTSAQSTVLTSTVSSETDSVPVSTTLGGDMTATSGSSEDTGTSSKAPTSIQAETSSSTESNVISTSSFVEQTTAESSVSTAATTETSSYVGTEASTPEGVTSGTATSLSAVDTEITSSGSASDMTNIGTTSTDQRLTSLESTTSGIEITTTAAPGTTLVQSPDTVSTVSSTKETGTTVAAYVSVESSSESILSTSGLTSVGTMPDSTETSPMVSVSPTETVSGPVSITASGDTTSTAPTQSTKAATEASTTVAATLGAAETTASSSTTQSTDEATTGSPSTETYTTTATSIGIESTTIHSSELSTDGVTSATSPKHLTPEEITMTHTESDTNTSTTILSVTTDAQVGTSNTGAESSDTVSHISASTELNTVSTSVVPEVDIASPTESANTVIEISSTLTTSSEEAFKSTPLYSSLMVVHLRITHILDQSVNCEKLATDPSYVKAITENICTATGCSHSNIIGCRSGSIFVTILACFHEDENITVDNVKMKIDDSVELPITIDMDHTFVEVYRTNETEVEPKNAFVGQTLSSPVESLKLTTDETVVQTDSDVDFLVTINRGTNVTCRIDYGDGQSEERELSFAMPHVFTHQFEDEDEMTVITTCYNELNSISATVIVEAVMPVPTPFIFSNSPVPIPDGAANILLVLPSTGKVSKHEMYSEWNFGDGVVRNITFSPKYGSMINLTHVYAKGTYSVSILLSNKVSQNILTLVIIAINMAGNTSISTENEFYAVGTQVFFHFNSPRALNGTLTMNYGDGKEDSIDIYNDDEPFVENVIHTYENDGNYSVSAMFSSPLQNVKLALPHEIVIQTPIGFLELEAPSEIYAPPYEAVFKVLDSGNSTDVSCEWMVNDIGFRSTFHEILGTDSDEVKYDFETSGSYAIKVRCKNMLSSQTKMMYISVVSKVTNLEVEINPTKLAVGTSMTLNMSIETGDNVSYSIQYGDGNSFHSDVYKAAMSTNHSYMLASSYNLIISARNSFSKKIVFRVIQVLDPITGLEISASYKKTIVSTEFVPGEGVNENQFPLRKTLYFKAMKKSGNNLLYRWIIDDLEIPSYDPDFSHTFTEEGDKVVRLIASNDLFLSEISINIEILSPVVILSVENNGPRKANDSMAFTLTTLKPTIDACFAWNMGDDSPVVIYGQTYDACRSLIPKLPTDALYSFRKANHSSEVMQHRYTYEETATYVVKVFSSNSVSNSQIETVAHVTSIPCMFPKVSFNTFGSNMDVSVKFRASDVLNMEAIVITDCGTNTDAYYKWSVQRVILANDGLQSQLVPFSVPQIEVGGYKFLKRISFPPRTFMENSYFKVKLQVTMRFNLNITTISHQYILALPTSFVPDLAVNNRLGYGDTLVLDATGTYDPDQAPGANKTGWSIELFCFRENEVLKNNSIEIVERADTRISKIDEDFGGCFGTGPGQLVLPSDSFLVKIPTVGMATGFIYFFTAKITSHDGETKEVTNNMELVTGDPPLATIMTSNKKMKFSPSLPITLVVECPACPHPKYVKYTWNVTLMSQLDNTVEEVLDLTSLSKAEGTFLEIFSNSLLEGSTYEVSATLEVFGRYPGKTSFLINTVRAPYGGACEVTPQSGQSLVTPFCVTCFNWINPEDDTDLYYEFYIQRDKYSRELLSYGFNTTQCVNKMKVGTENNFTHVITCSIAHQTYHVFVKKELRLQVTPKVAESFEEGLEIIENVTKETSLLFQQGRQREALQNIASVYEFLTANLDGKNETSSANFSIQQQIASEMVTQLAEGSTATLDTTLDVSVAEHVVETISFMLKTPKALTPESYETLADLAIKSGEAAQRIALTGNSDPETLHTAMTPFVETIGSIIEAVEELDLNRDAIEESIDKAKEQSRDVLASTLTADGQQTSIETDKLQMLVSKKSTADIAESVPGESSQFKLPSDGVFTDPTASSVIMTLIEYKGDGEKSARYSYSNSSRNIGTVVAEFGLSYPNGSEIRVSNMSNYVVIDLDVITSREPTKNNYTLSQNSSVGIMQHVFTVTDTKSALLIVIRPEIEGMVVNAYLKHLEPATETSFDITSRIPHFVNTEYIPDVSNMTLDEMRHTFFVPQSTIEVCGVGDYYLILVPVENLADDTTSTLPSTVDSSVSTLSFVISSSVRVCQYWNQELKSFDDEGCYVSVNSFSNRTRCLCNHLTTFGADFIVPPNTIDFDTVFVDMDEKLADNYAVLTFICVVLGVYILVIIYVRRKDKQDIEKWGVTPLKDNLLNEKFFYEISIYTGMRAKGGTKSNASFVLCGDQTDTGVRRLSDGKLQGFARGSVTRFVMSTEGGLGNLLHLRLWHDNCGKGSDASWYVNRLLVQDLQTGIISVFLVNQWLAVEEDDGIIDRVIPVSSYEEITSFRNLFSDLSQKKMTDGHLWVSVFSRPDRSYFTRVQRASVILSLLFLTMVVNAMFYGRDEGITVQNIRFGFINFNTFQLWVSLVGSVIVMPPSMAIDHLFRKSKPKPTKVDVLKAETRIKEELTEDVPDVSKSKLKKKNAKKLLPYWCKYVAWLLVFLTTVSSAFFMFLYSIQWGKQKSEEWLMSMLMSIGQSVLIVQPIKVFLVVAIISTIFRKPEFSEVDDDPDEKLLNALPGHDELMIEIQGKTGKRKKIPVKPMDPQILMKARETRLREMEMFAVLKDICFYIIFLSLLLYTVQQTRQNNAYLIHSNMESIFIDLKFNTANNVDKFWYWAHNTLVDGLYYTKEYNDERTESQYRRYLRNKISYRVGVPRIRQLRILPGKCKVHPLMKNISGVCNSEYSFFKENKNDYHKLWVPCCTNATSEVRPDPTSPWSYRNVLEMGGLPHWGLAATYNGGGYGVDLKGNVDAIKKQLLDLDASSWIDKYTRAVFIEFVVFNANTNLFTRMQILFEFTNLGNVFRTFEVQTIRLFSYVGPIAYFTTFCQISLVAFIIFFLVKEIKRVVKERRKYFSKFWNIMEFCKLCLGISSIAMYIVKSIYTYVALDDLEKHKGNFLNLHRIAIWNETLVFVSAFVCFISMLQILNLLRFNSRITLLGLTLRTSCKELTYFSVTFFIIFLAFAQFAYLAFSSNLIMYSTFITTMESLLSHLFGHIHFESMSMAYGTLGLVYYLCFLLVSSFILLNMFVSILNDVMNIIKNDIPGKVQEYNLAAFVWKTFQESLGIDIDRLFRRRPENDSKLMSNIEKVEKMAEENRKQSKERKLIQVQELEKKPQLPSVDRSVSTSMIDVAITASTSKKTGPIEIVSTVPKKASVLAKTSKRVDVVEKQLDAAEQMVTKMEMYMKRMTETRDERSELLEDFTDVLFINNPGNMSAKQQFMVYQAARTAILGLGVAWATESDKE